MEKKFVQMLVISVILGLIIIFIAYSYASQVKITNFDECIAAGNPAMESYPRQCMANGQTFVEEIDDAWRLDDIQLMQHETEGYFGCFGCSVPSGGEETGQAMCVDPAFEMKPAEETAERYCDEEFNVVSVEEENEN